LGSFPIPRTHIREESLPTELIIIGLLLERVFK
jgi:hypothetical protein